MAAWETISAAFHLVLRHLLEETLGILEIQSRTEKMQKEVRWRGTWVTLSLPWDMVNHKSPSDKPGSYGHLKTLGFDSESNRLSFVHQKPLLRLVKRRCHTLLPQSTPPTSVSLIPPGSHPYQSINTRWRIMLTTAKDPAAGAQWTDHQGRSRNCAKQWPPDLQLQTHAWPIQ